MLVNKQQITPSCLSGFHLVVPHAAFGVIVVKEVFQVDPLHLQACLIDPEAESILVRFHSNKRKRCFSFPNRYSISVTELILTKCCTGCWNMRRLLLVLAFSVVFIEYCVVTNCPWSAQKHWLQMCGEEVGGTNKEKQASQRKSSCSLSISVI